MLGIMKVETLANNQVVITQEDTGKVFVSYGTPIAQWKDGKLIVTKYWDYSRTTLRWFYTFIDYFVYDKEISEVITLKSKKPFIQKLIDKGVIEMEEN